MSTYCEKPQNVRSTFERFLVFLDESSYSQPEKRFHVLQTMKGFRQMKGFRDFYI